MAYSLSLLLAAMAQAGYDFEMRWDLQKNHAHEKVQPAALCFGWGLPGGGYDATWSHDEDAIPDFDPTDAASIDRATMLAAAQARGIKEAADGA